MIPDSPVDHLSAQLAVTPQQNSAQSQPRSLPNLTVVLAVLGSIVLLLLTVLVLLLCQVRERDDQLTSSHHSFALQKPKQKRNIPSRILSSVAIKERQLRANEAGDLANFI